MIKPGIAGSPSPRFHASNLTWVNRKVFKGVRRRTRSPNLCLSIAIAC